MNSLLDPLVHLVAFRARRKLIPLLVVLGFVSQIAVGQGPMTNGFTHTGTLLSGQQLTWTFAANSGDGILIKLGEAVVGSSLYPRLRVFGPGGVLLGESAGSTAAEVATRATNGGTFSAVIANDENARAGGAGGYRLTLAKTGAAVFVAPYDEGGPLTNNVRYEATNGVAGLDLWTFNACPGAAVSLQIVQLSGGASFSPELILYAPDGTLLDRVSGSAAAQINRVAPLPGRYLLIVGDTVGGYGTYQLTGHGFAAGLAICPPERAGMDFVLHAMGGPVGSNYVVWTTTNLIGPLTLWAPLRTNQFNLSGESSVSNPISLAVPQQYFQLRPQ